MVEEDTLTPFSQNIRRRLLHVNLSSWSTALLINHKSRNDSLAGQDGGLSLSSMMPSLLYLLISRQRLVFKTFIPSSRSHN